MKAYKINRKVMIDILRLKMGIITNCSQHVLKFPVCVISIDEVTDNGTIYFYMPNPIYDNSDEILPFFAELSLFNRKLNYNMRLKGFACVVTNQTVVGDGGIISNSTRIGVRIAEYEYGRKSKPTPGIFSRYFSGILKFIQVI